MTKANAVEEQMLKLINHERAIVGAAPLKFNDTLNTSSEMHSRWMLESDKFSHDGESGSTPHARMQDAGYPFEGNWRSGENIAYQSERGAPGLSDDVKDLHEGLMKSPGHRENILNPDFTEIGIGIEQGDFRSNGKSFDSVMVSQNFASSDADTTPAKDPSPKPDAKDPAPTPDVTDPDVTPDAKDPAPTPDVTDPDVTPDAKDPAPTPEVTDPDVTPDAKDPAPTPDVTPVTCDTPSTGGGLFDMLFGGGNGGGMPDNFFFGFTGSSDSVSDGGTWNWVQLFVFTPDQNSQPDQVADQGCFGDGLPQVADAEVQVNDWDTYDAGFDCGWG